MSLRRIGDTLIMEVSEGRGYQGMEIMQLKLCRVFHGSLNISKITCGYGRGLMVAATNIKAPILESEYNWLMENRARKKNYCTISS